MQAGSKTQNPNRLTTYIMVSLLLGIAVGYACNTFASPEQAKVIAGYFAILSDIFLRMIKMIIAPLVFATIVSGITSLGASSGAVGRIAVKSLAWFITASLVSLLVGLVLANLLQPGHGLGLALPEANATTNVQTSSLNIKDFAAHVFPISVVQAMAGNEVLQILVFSMFFGFALSAVKATLAPDIAKSIDQIVPVMLKFTDYVMRFAPVGVFAAMAAVITTQGLGVLVTYGKFVSAFYFGLVVLWAIIIGAGSVVLGGAIKPLLRLLRQPMMIAFSTSSSEAAFPKMIEQLMKFGVSERITGFVLPLGFLQSRRLDDVPDLCGAVRRPGLRHRDADFDPDRDAASSDDHQQRHRRGAARLPGRGRCDASHFRPACGGPRPAHRHRRLPGHGTDDDQRHRQRCRYRGSCEVGERTG